MVTLMTRITAPWRLHGLILALGLVLGASITRGDTELPASMEVRRHEVLKAEENAASWKSQMAQREKTVIAAAPEFLAKHRAVQAVELSQDERTALLKQGLASLPPEKVAVFEAASGPMTAMKGHMHAYFEAYDRYEAAEIHARIVGGTLEIMEQRELLAPHLKVKTMGKLDRALAKLVDSETGYRKVLTDPQARNHHISNAIKAYWDLHEAAQKFTEPLMRKYRLAPRLTLWQKLGGFIQKIHHYGRLTRIGASTLPALGRMLGYLYNPFRKTYEPGKVNDQLRFFAKSYRWASGMKVKVVGAENLPKDRPVILAFSHRSEIEDAVVMMSVTPGDYGFMVAQRAIPQFLNDKLLKVPNVINVGGSTEGGGQVDSVAKGIENVKAGRNLVIFPEGTTSSEQQETRPLRSGIDLVADATMEKPVAIVSVTIDDPSNDYDDPEHLSLSRKIEVTVTFSRPIDPLKFKAVPGSDRELLLDTLRAFWHRNLYRPDVSLETKVQDLGTMPVAREESFQALYGEDVPEELVEQ